MTLTNKTAIVTGATGNGMGRSIALTLAREGVNVVINYRKNKVHAEKIVEYVNNTQKANAISFKADIFNDRECKELIDATMEQFGSVDILVVNPGANWNMESIDNLNVENSLTDIKNEISPIYHFFPTGASL